ncbi:MAG TPA: hypothetical protein ENK51_09725 [Gammaproteobacteria bacterium]|nr:hypothetical protein [Gammaproteobacteria bacterium]
MNGPREAAARFLSTAGRPSAVALRFTRHDQLVAGLAPAGVRPCWAQRAGPPRSRWRACNLPTVRGVTGRAGRPRDRPSLPRSGRAAESG